VNVRKVNKLLESAKGQLAEADEPIDVYKGVNIYALPSYNTPYFYALGPAQFKLGRVNHVQSIKMLTKRIDKWLDSAKGEARTRLGEGEGDEEKSLQAMISWVEDLGKKGRAALVELKSKKEPGRECQDLMSKIVRVRDEEWYENFYH
jgi:hypothetical protein